MHELPLNSARACLAGLRSYRQEEEGEKLDQGGDSLHALLGDSIGQNGTYSLKRRARRYGCKRSSATVQETPYSPYRGNTTANKDHPRSFLSRVSQVASILGSVSHLGNKWRQDGLPGTTYSEVIKGDATGQQGGPFQWETRGLLRKAPKDASKGEIPKLATTCTLVLGVLALEYNTFRHPGVAIRE